MHKGTLRGFVALGLLVAGLVFAYFTGQFGFASGVDSTTLRYIADIDYWQRTSREQVVVATAAFDLNHDLNAVPVKVGDWVGEDVPQSNIGVFMVLEPEQYVERLYRNGTGQYLWLTMIGGRGSRTFHPPESCYDSYGWQTQLSSHSIPLADEGALYGMLIEAHKDQVDQLSYYLYLFPDRRRDPTDGIVIFRVTSPFYDTLEATMVLQADFVRHFFTRSTLTGAR